MACYVQETYALNTTVGDVGRHLNYDQKPYLDIRSGLDSLNQLPCIVLDAGLVFLHPLDCLDAILLFEESGVHGSVWKEEVDGDRPG